MTEIVPATLTEPIDAISGQPMRIKRLTLTDFRAFPGPAPTHFDLDGKNVLVYGENGSGKSSIFHALNGFFALKPSGPLLNHKNVFSDLPDADCKVLVQFSDDTPPVEWTAGSHPGSLQGLMADRRVIEAALRCACLDYRALLDTNYKQGNAPVNLFDIAVEHLLRDFPVTASGGTSITIGELWDKVQRNKPDKHTSIALERVNQACTEFNIAFRSAFTSLVPIINDLMQLLGWQDVKLEDFDTPGLTYNNARQKRDRAIDGQQLTPKLFFRAHPLQTPQLFLNEARLSALGLAIYLAGRLACTPTATATALKLLVLDDVLIGLDHSNRLPVLDVLSNRFADWQIVLLTHDRNWFDLARSHLTENAWKCLEIYEGDSAANAPMPIVQPTKNRTARALLVKAEELVQTPYIEAAANYTRQAFELGARNACELKKIEIPYKVDPKKHKLQNLVNKLKKWSGTDKAPKAEWDAAIQRLEVLKNVVMNPYSHPSAPNIPKQEVEQAIDAVKKFLELAGRK